MNDMSWVRLSLECAWHVWIKRPFRGDFYRKKSQKAILKETNGRIVLPLCLKNGGAYFLVFFFFFLVDENLKTHLAPATEEYLFLLLHKVSAQHQEDVQTTQEQTCGCHVVLPTWKCLVMTSWGNLSFTDGSVWHLTDGEPCSSDEKSPRPI